MNKADKAYTQEMLTFARSIKGRDLTVDEAKVRQEAIAKGDDWLYFTVFGIQPDTQRYIDKTIELLEKCSTLPDQVVCNCRMDFTIQDLGISYPAGSSMEKHLQAYNEWKARKDEAKENVQHRG